MMCAWIRLLALPASMVVSHALAGACDTERTIWTNTGPNGVRHVVYRVFGVSDMMSTIPAFGALFIEEWRAGRLAWRTAALTTCSNGESTCYAFVQRNNGEPGASNGREGEAARASGSDALGDTTITIIETTTREANGQPEWLVLAGLKQDLFDDGAKVEWYNGFHPLPGERPLAPDIYKFSGCGHGAILPEPSSLFVDPLVCPHCRKTGLLELPERFTPSPGAVLWMKGNQIGGRDLKCDIRSFNVDNTISADCVKGNGSAAAQPTTFRFAYEWDRLILDNEEMELCSR
jgi:hypothetical protein